MASTQMDDFVFAGAGASGLVTATVLLERFPDATATLVDPSLADLKNKTYAFWSEGVPPLAEAVSKSWDRVALFTARADVERSLDTYRYHVITGADLRDVCVRRLRATGRARFLHQRAGAAREADGVVELLTPTRTARGRFLFDSRDPHPAGGVTDGHVALEQQFVGWDVVTDRDAFDPGRVTLFDFRVPQEHDQRFVYVLPYDPRTALVEHVSLRDCDHEAILTEYAKERLGLARYRVTRKEAGKSLLTDAPFTRRFGERGLRIGLAGGRLKPTSGYAFTRIVDDARAIADSLDRHAHPFDLPETPSIFAYLDRLFLEVTADRPEAMGDIFAAMFHHNPPDRVFRFLDERASTEQIVALGSQLPLGPFIKALGVRFLPELRRQLGDVPPA